jgi:hypothetical protein
MNPAHSNSDPTGEIILSLQGLKSIAKVQRRWRYVSAEPNHFR